MGGKGKYIYKHCSFAHFVQSEDRHNVLVHPSFEFLNSMVFVREDQVFALLMSGLELVYGLLSYQYSGERLFNVNSGRY